jgi:hypothetical protein
MKYGIFLKGVVGVNKARVKENCFFIIESWEKKYYEKNMMLWLDKATQKWFDWLEVFLRGRFIHIILILIILQAQINY